MTDNGLMLTLIAALLGAGLMSASLRRSRVAPLWRVLAGLACGAFGAQVFMLPLNYCPFDPERSTWIDHRFGVFLILVGVVATLIPARLLLLRYVTQKRALPVIDTPPGAFKGWLLPILFLAPTIVILALFLYYPSLDTFNLSTLLVRFGNPRTVPVCVSNFTRLLATTAPSFPPSQAFLDWIFEPTYARVVFQTLTLSGAIVVLTMGLSLLVATVAFLPLKGASIYRTLLIWPYAISPAVAGIIFLLMFNPLGGIINYALQNTFGVQVGWLNDQNAAPFTIIIASVWKSMGFNILFFIAGLQNVPKDLIEAAAIDGANLWQRFRTIVLPMLSPISFFLLITNLTYAFFDTFGTIDYLTKGGPVGSTTTMMYQVYLVGVGNGDLGKAAAQSLILFALVIGITVLQFRTTGENVNYGA